MKSRHFSSKVSPIPNLICSRNEYIAGFLNLLDFGSQTARNTTGEDEERARGGPRENIRARGTRYESYECG